MTNYGYNPYSISSRIGSRFNKNNNQNNINEYNNLNLGINPYTGNNLSEPIPIYNTSPRYNQVLESYQGYGIPGISNYNIPNIGYTNYYGGYTYTNPFIMQQLRNQEIQNQKKEIEKRRDLMIALSKVANSHMSKEELEDHLKMYEEKEPDSEEYEKYLKEKRYQSLRNSIPVENHPTYIYNKQCMDMRRALVSEESNKYNKDTDTIWDFVDKMDLINRDIKEKELLIKKRDMSNLYNQSAYNTLLDKYTDNKSSYFSSIYNSISVDDMEVTPPSSISGPMYADRRARFIQSILGGSND